MVILVRLFGILIMLIGLLFTINPEFLKQYMSFWNNEKRLKIGGAGAILCGAIFLVAAPECRIVWLITILGIWSVIKGVLLFTISPERIYAYLDWWKGTSVLATRILGIIAIAIGALFIYSA